MDRTSIIEWQTGAQPAVNLLANAVCLINDEAVLDDISLLGRVGNHVIDLADFITGAVREPSDPVQKVHWGQLLALAHDWGMEITHAATVTFDLNATGALGSKIAGEITALTDRWVEANASGT